MTSNIALFSVLFLAVIVAIAFWRKCNIGILAIGGAFILGTLSGMSGKEILAGFVISGAMSAAFSPASTGGGLIMAAYMTASNSENKEEEQNKLFGTLFVIALACVALNVLFPFLGVYKLGYALFG